MRDGGFTVGAENDPVRMKKIFDRGAFAQKFRIRRHVEKLPGDTVAFDGAANPVVGIHRHRAFLDDDLVGLNGARDFAGHGVYIGQIGVATLALRGTYRDEDGLRLLGGMAKVGGELNHAADPVSSQQLGKKLLVDGHDTLVKLIHLGFIVVDTEHAMADFRKACGRHQTHISRSNYCDCNRFVHFVFSRSGHRCPE